MTKSSNLDFDNKEGTWYMLPTSYDGITALVGTLQNKLIFWISSYFIFLLLLQTIISGWIPAFKSSLTECWVGFVLISPDVSIYGSKVKCMSSVSSCLSFLNCLMASKKGRLSISPTVPPISQIITSVSYTHLTLPTKA